MFENMPNWLVVINVVIILIAATIAFAGNYFKNILGWFNSFVLNILYKTPSNADEDLYILILTGLNNYIDSEIFAVHWLRFKEMLSDGMLTKEEIHELKIIFTTKIVAELKKEGLDLYDKEARAIIWKAIDDCSEYIKESCEELGWIKKTALKVALAFVKSWLKKFFDSVLKEKRI
jgi:hypothetical protein